MVAVTDRRRHRPGWQGTLTRMTRIEIRRGGLLAAVTLLAGAAAAWIAARSEPGFRDVLEPVQLAMSVLVPFFGVLAVTGRPRTAADRHLAPRVLAAIGLAVAFALAGALLAATATRWAGGAWPSASRAAALVLGSLLVQTIAQSAGTGCGLLLRRPAVAMAATIVVPMSVTVLLGAIDPGGGLVRWLTPYGNAHSLLTGTPTAGFGVVVMLWCVVPNLLGARLAASRAAVDPRGSVAEPGM
jgi:hypothetical protein